MASNSSTARVLPCCSIVWRMVRTNMSPERPVLGTMSATSAFLSAGSPACRRPEILTRRPAPMRRGMGMGGSTMPLLGWPSGPMSRWRTVSAKNRPNQCGGSSLPRLKLAGSMSNVPAARRTAIRPISSSTVRTRPIHGRNSFIASSIQLIASSSVARETRMPPGKEEGPAFAGPFHGSKDFRRLACGVPPRASGGPASPNRPGGRRSGRSRCPSIRTGRPARCAASGEDTPR